MTLHNFIDAAMDLNQDIVQLRSYLTMSVDIFELIEHNNMDAIRELSKTHFDFNCTDRYGYTPLHFACLFNYTKLVLMLLNDLNISTNITSRNRDTPLHNACRNGHVNIVIALIAKDANVNATNIYGETPLHKACRESHIEIVRILLLNDAGIDHTNNDGNTPLHIACRNNNVEIVRILLEFGADTTIINYGRKRALDVNVGCNRNDIRKLFEQLS